MRRAIRVIGVVLIVALAAVAIVSWGTSARKSDARTAAQAFTPGSTLAHRQAAIQDARERLASVVTPQGAVVVSHRSGAGPDAQVVIGASDSAVDREVWTVDAHASAVFSYVLARLPSGSKVMSSGSGGPVFSEMVIRVWPPRPGVFGGRWLDLQVTATGADQTRLTAIAQTEWIEDRPANERIPTTAQQASINEAVPGRRPLYAQTITRPHAVAALRRLLNALPIAQPASINCPAEPLKPLLLTITFRQRAGGPALAQIQVLPSARYHWPPATAGWDCVGAQVTIEGHPRPALAGDIVDPIQHVLHARFATKENLRWARNPGK